MIYEHPWLSSSSVFVCFTVQDFLLYLEHFDKGLVSHWFEKKFCNKNFVIY